MTIHESQPQQTTIDAFGKENKKKLICCCRTLKKYFVSIVFFHQTSFVGKKKFLIFFFSFSPPRETNGEGTWEKKNQQPLKQKRKPGLERKRSPLLTHDLWRPSSRWKLNFNLDSEFGELFGQKSRYCCKNIIPLGRNMSLRDIRIPEFLVAAAAVGTEPRAARDGRRREWLACARHWSRLKMPPAVLMSESIFPLRLS